MKKTYLDKIFEVGTSYKTHERVAYIIKKLGTNDTSSIYLKIQNWVTGNLIQNVAPAYKTDSTNIGPLNLEGLYYVIPPKTDFSVVGTSGKYMRAIGYVLLLDPGEVLPAEHQSRFQAQFNSYKTYVTGTYDFGSATAWSAGDEVELYSLTPKTNETYIFNDLLLIEYTGFTANPGDVTIQFYIDNNPLEYLYDSSVNPGIDLLSIPSYSGVSANEDVFKLRDLPIELEGDHTLKITAKNVSGSDISLSSASITLYAVVQYHRKG